MYVRMAEWKCHWDKNQLINISLWQIFIISVLITLEQLIKEQVLLSRLLLQILIICIQSFCAVVLAIFVIILDVIRIIIELLEFLSSAYSDMHHCKRNDCSCVSSKNSKTGLDSMSSGWSRIFRCRIAVMHNYFSYVRSYWSVIEAFARAQRNFFSEISENFLQPFLIVLITPEAIATPSTLPGSAPDITTLNTITRWRVYMKDNHYFIILLSWIANAAKLVLPRRNILEKWGCPITFHLWTSGPTGQK